MTAEIFKLNSARTIKDDWYYRPVFIIINQKIYPVSEWHEGLKLLLYTFCYKNNKTRKISKETDKKDLDFETVLFSTKYKESSNYAKFSPDLTVKVFTDGAKNCQLVKRLYKQLGKFDFYVLRTDREHLDEGRVKKLISRKKQELVSQYKYKNGSTKHVIAHINGKVLDSREKFFRRAERDFDRSVLIGDVEVRKKEEMYLNEYMKYALTHLIKRNKYIQHEKLFALGLVRVAMKHYSAKTFWPYLRNEYGVDIPLNGQSVINMKFREVLKKHNKPFDDSTNYVQNVCMHAFVCDKCADQFFDYMFDFWRIDLSRSIENMMDMDGNNLFNILIDEIRNKYRYSINLNDVMIHTTMALIKNPRGSKNRFRHILRMIDNSYWNNADYSASKNRLTVLFNQWRNKPSGTFERELKRTAEGRKAGRGEKLLSRPILFYDSKLRSFQIALPKQILRHCTETEHPVWYVTVDENTSSEEPVLMQGKSSLFTDECRISLSDRNVFKKIEIILKSERATYFRRIINEDDVRFFNANGRCLDILDGYIPKDVAYAFVKNRKHLRSLNSNVSENRYGDGFMTFCQLNVSEGDILILPDEKAISVGRILTEGVIGRSRVSGVTAIYNGESYEIASNRENIFFKAKKNQLRGTSIRIICNSEEICFSRIDENKLTHFRLYEEAEDIFGYIIDLHDYIPGNGVYDFQLSIPGNQVKSYKICYLRKFTYTFDDAPYIFEETGTISFPGYVDMAVNDEWERTSSAKKLTFSLNETGREENRYVKDRKLHLDYSSKNMSVQLEFDLPVFYWKSNLNNEWNYRMPGDSYASKLPAYIYIGGGVDCSNASMIVKDLNGLEETEVPVRFNSEKDLYYFRTIDFAEYLNREMIFRNILIRIDKQEFVFTRVVCRSFVTSQNITGDFEKNTIYGNFSIIGVSEYMVTVWFGNELIEEDIPVKDGHFQLKCDINEGIYTIKLYELEDDGSGFGAISYEIGSYKLLLRDVNSLTDSDLFIRSIQDRKGIFARIPLMPGYIIRNLKKLKFDKDIIDRYDIPSWLYDSGDPDIMRRFAYYEGRLLRSLDKAIKICDVLVIFDNVENMGEALIFEKTEDEVLPMAINMKTGRLIASSGLSTKQFRNELGRTINVIDDDLYRISVEVRE